MTSLRHILRRLPHTALAALAAAAGMMTPSISAAAPALDLSPYRGKVVYLDFWASWCQPCKDSFPYMQRLEQTYGRDGFVVIAVNVDHSRARADQFLSAMGGGLQVVFDPHGDLAGQFKVHDMPTSFLIGRDGRVRYTHNGFHPEQLDLYGEQISELIHEK